MCILVSRDRLQTLTVQTCMSCGPWKYRITSSINTILKVRRACVKVRLPDHLDQQKCKLKKEWAIMVI